MQRHNRRLPKRKSHSLSNSYKMIAKLELMRAACGLRLPAYESRTLIALSSLLNERTGSAFPAHSTLAGLVNIHERNVDRALKGLQRRGLVAIAEPGTSRRTTRYTVNVAAILTARGISTDGAEASPEMGQRHLYRCLRGISTDGAAASPEMVKGQRSASETQVKRQLNLSASLSARGTLRSSSGPRAERRTIRNAWLAKYREAAD